MSMQILKFIRKILFQVFEDAKGDYLCTVPTNFFWYVSNAQWLHTGWRGVQNSGVTFSLGHQTNDYRAGSTAFWQQGFHQTWSVSCQSFSLAIYINTTECLPVLTIASRSRSVPFWTLICQAKTKVVKH